jgi:glycosyltransferase involved in cell wall biosynthesis
VRIALVSTLRTAVPPPRTGSVELIVSLMAEALVRRGHDVTVFAPGDSKVSGRLSSLLPVGYHHDETVWDWRLAEFMQLGAVYEKAAEFDVINSHVYCYALPFTRLVATPTVHTFHICPTPDFVRFCRLHPEGRYVLISDFQRRFFENVPVAAVVRNGIDTEAFRFHANPGSYFVYLGDIRPDKGPLEAIKCARAVGVPIKLAGPSTEYFHQVVKAQVDGRDVEYVGEVDHGGKVALLERALALLFPSQGLEACPLVVLEAMACGTPVLALDSGPVPELVEEGVAGFCAPDIERLIEAARRVSSLDRHRVRRLALERFDVSRMVDDYLRVFERAAESGPVRNAMPT